MLCVMQNTGMNGKEQEAVFTLVASILHLGNIKFKEGRGEGVDCADLELVRGWPWLSSPPPSSSLLCPPRARIYAALCRALSIDGDPPLHSTLRTNFLCPQVEFVSSLLRVDSAALAFALTHRHIVSGNEEMDVVNNEVQAVVVRDALAKALYSRLFDWLVQRVNSAILVEDPSKCPLSVRTRAPMPLRRSACSTARVLDRGQTLGLVNL